MGNSTGTWSSPQWISGLQNALGPWLAQNFSQQQGSYPGYLNASVNPYSGIVGQGLLGMLFGGTPTGLQAQSNNLSSFLGMPSYGAYTNSPYPMNFGYPNYNPYYTQGYTGGNTNGGGSNTGGGAGGNQSSGYQGSDRGTADTQYPNSYGYNWAGQQMQNFMDRDPFGNMPWYQDATVQGPNNPNDWVIRPNVTRGGAGNGRPVQNPGSLSNPSANGYNGNGTVYDETSWLQQQIANGQGNGTYGTPSQSFWQPYQNQPIPQTWGGSDYTGQSSWLNQVPGMVGQGIGNANSLIAQLIGQGGGGGTIPHTAENAFEAMLTSKGWNDAPIGQAQSALAGLQGSSPGIWGGVSGNLNDIMATGAPVNVTPQWQQMTGAMDIARDKQLAQAAESYAAGNKRFGSGAANQFGNVAAEAAAQQNALLGQMTQQALEAAANRRLTATGQGAALGQMQAMLPIEQANALLNSGVQDRGSWANLLGAASNAAGQYGRLGLDATQQQWNNILNAAGMMGNLGISGAQTLGNLGLNASEQQAQNAQQQWQNQMSMLQALSGYGNQMQGLSQDALNRIYGDYQLSQQMPFLPYASQLAGLSQLGYNQSQWPGIVGGIGGLLGGLGDIGALDWLKKLFGGGGSGTSNMPNGTGGSAPGWWPDWTGVPWWLPGGGGIYS